MVHQKRSNFCLPKVTSFFIQAVGLAYLSLDTDNNEFRFGAGSVVSYQEYGSYKIADGKIIATSQSTTFEFEIHDKNTLILIDNGDNDFFKIPINTQFVYSEDLK